jgi:tRNA modification GTPase
MRVDASQETIVALSSGQVPSGVAVIRLSGQAVPEAVGRLCGSLPDARKLVRRALRSADGGLIDDAMVVVFAGPSSFTGEDCAELHVHGSRAVVSKVLEELTAFDGVRLADAGEFTRRAFENGKLDLTSVEGLGDLIASETEGQRQIAIERAAGGLDRKVSEWRAAISGLRAELEANLDFADEDDVPDEIDPRFGAKLNDLIGQLNGQLDRSKGMEIVRDGFRVVLAGAPNTGKSSLLNALAGREVAIVTEEPGTTRDVREVQLDVNGQLIRLFDIAGLRDTESLAEAEGVRRARQVIDEAELVIWLVAPDVDFPLDEVKNGHLVVGSKSDIGSFRPGTCKPDLSISSASGVGLDSLIDLIAERAGNMVARDPGVVTRERDRIAVREAIGHLIGVEDVAELELKAEMLRSASLSLERLTGHIGAEDVLDSLFSGFCIGK